VVGDEAQTVVQQNDAQQPHHETDDTRHGDADHPEPQEQVDLLVVEVDRQYALDRVGLDVAEVLATHAQVAQRDARKRHRHVVGPVGVRDDTTHQVHAERRVASGQDSVENEQLTEHVDDVAQLGEQEQRHQVAAQSTRHAPYAAQRSTSYYRATLC